ncbi:hypothetical protein [Niastella vici]|uniref:hypothetical protein n=1 Tax=Niastella vici TaxID=1703345 RepID=UPI00156E1EA8|nr:hypothetical protein [Niastella vici]
MYTGLPAVQERRKKQVTYNKCRMIVYQESVTSYRLPVTRDCSYFGFPGNRKLVTGNQFHKSKPGYYK